MLLKDQGPDAGGWIVTIFELFKPPWEFEGITFDKLLDRDDKCSVRDLLVSQVALLAGVYFVHLAIAWAEHLLAGNELIQGRIETLLRISAAYPWPTTPRPWALPPPT
jgi:hypothetical protein